MWKIYLFHEKPFAEIRCFWGKTGLKTSVSAVLSSNIDIKAIQKKLGNKTYLLLYFGYLSGYNFEDIIRTIFILYTQRLFIWYQF